jgi:predicted metal-dependent peptidase
MKSVPMARGTGSGGCGSVAHGHKESHELPGAGNDKVPAGVSKAEAELIRQKVAQDVESAAKTRGTVPGWLERWARERLKSKVDWRRVLTAYIRRACGEVQGAMDYTYQKLGRRSSALPDFVLPALRAPNPQIAVVVDTSGSMSEKELSQALAEIAAVLESGGRRGVTVLSCDAAVHTTQKVFKAADVKLGGGGGTDMTIGIQAAIDLKPQPHVVILVTDGETPYPAAPTKVPLIVALTQAKPGYATPPSWAKVVIVEPEGGKA